MRAQGFINDLPMDRPPATNFQKTTLHVSGLRAGYRDPGSVNPFEHRVVIDGIDLKVGSGEIVGIQGPNASGKSTLLSAIVDPDQRLSGSVRCGNLALRTGETAYVPQSAAETLSPWLSVAEEIALPLRIEGTPLEERRQQVVELMSQNGIELPLDRKVKALSGGQRVKVALLRSFAVKSIKLFVLDEPFEGLDAGSRLVLLKAIRQVAQRGVPVLLTSHREDDLRALGARMMRLSGSPVNRIVPTTTSGKHVDLTSGAYKKQSQDRLLSEERAPSLSDTSHGPTSTSEESAGDALSRSSVEPEPGATRGLSIIPAMGVLAGLGIWRLAAMIVGDPGLLPGPLSVFEEAVGLLFNTDRLWHFGATMIRAGAGWFLANLMAVPVGILLGYDRRIYSAASPWLSLGRTLPVFVLLGPAIGLFPGYSELQRGFLIWLTLYLISIQSVSAASAFAPRARLRIARIFGAGHRFRLKDVLFHESMGGIFSALEITLPLAVIVSLVVEIFLIPQTGLGVYIFNNLTAGDLSTLFAHILLPGIVAAVGMWGLRLLGSQSVERA